MDKSETYTLEQGIDYMGMGKFQWRLLIMLGFCLMADSTETMFLTVLGPALKCDWLDVTDFQIASLTTSVFAGTMCGGLLFGMVADKHGRRRVILASGIVNTVFGILTAVAPSYYWVLLARTVVGFGLAGTTQGNTLLIEYLPSFIRGTGYNIMQIFWSAGAFFVYTMAMFIVPSYGWRLFTVLTALPMFIVVISLYFIPESSRYYLASGQQEKAERVLKQITLTNDRPLPPGKLVDTVAEEECGSVKQLFHSNFRRTSFLLIPMWITIAMSYYGIVLINTTLMTLPDDKTSVTNQSSTITSPQCKMLATDDYLSLIFTTFGELLGIPLLLVLLPRYGRRTICAINYSFSSVCFALFLFVPHHGSWMVTLITFVARMFINAQSNLMYLYTMEVYPTVIRAVALGCATSISRVGAMVAPYLAQVLMRETFNGTIVVFILTTAVAAICAILLPIETKDRELKQATFDSSIPSMTSDSVVASAWTPPSNPTTSLMKENNRVVNNGYETIREETTNDRTKTQ